MDDQECKYSVMVLDSDPDSDKCDLYFVREFQDRDSAYDCYSSPISWLRSLSEAVYEGYWISLDGPDISAKRPLVKGEWVTSKRELRSFDQMVESERLWEHRMLYGRDPD